jgi:two-component system response regulator LytT
MIRVILVDDEPLALEELSRLIGTDAEFEIVARASDGKEALEEIKKTPVDVAFLDIDMPGLNGLEVADRLASDWETPPLVVFATAHNQYAIEAFEANAVDYILKPFDPERLNKTLARIKEELKSRHLVKEKIYNVEDYLIQKKVLKKLVGRKRLSREKVIIDPHQVYFFHARLADVTAQLTEDEFLVNNTLKELAANLDQRHFTQVHKAYIVNLDRVEKVIPLFSGNYQVSMKGGKFLVPLSRRYVKKMKQLLRTW